MSRITRYVQKNDFHKNVVLNTPIAAMNGTVLANLTMSIYKTKDNKPIKRVNNISTVSNWLHVTEMVYLTVLR